MIDACVFHDWSSMDAVASYVPSGWHDFVLEPRVTVAVPPMFPDPPDRDGTNTPFADHDGLAARLAEAGTSPERIVLSYKSSALATTHMNQFVAHAIAEAGNRWTEEEWLARDERLHGLVLAPCAMPEVAAAEIRRAGANPQMVGVLLGGAVLGSPLGHPVYHPIYEAASELGLPIIIQEGLDASESALTPPVSGGRPATAGEYRAFAWHQQLAHVVSLMVQGVFDRFPNLNVLLVGAGAAWLPAQLWHVDGRYGASRGDARWLKQRPLDYADRIWTTTFRLERPPQPDALGRALATLPGMEQRMLYASGSPDRDSQDTEQALEGLPEDWRPGVLYDNALRFFRWPGEQPTISPATIEESHV